MKESDLVWDTDLALTVQKIRAAEQLAAEEEAQRRAKEEEELEQARLKRPLPLPKTLDFRSQWPHKSTLV